MFIVGIFGWKTHIQRDFSGLLQELMARNPFKKEKEILWPYSLEPPFGVFGDKGTSFSMINSRLSTNYLMMFWLWPYLGVNVISGLLQNHSLNDLLMSWRVVL